MTCPDHDSYRFGLGLITFLMETSQNHGKDGGDESEEEAASMSRRKRHPHGDQVPKQRQPGPWDLVERLALSQAALTASRCRSIGQGALEGKVSGSHRLMSYGEIVVSHHGTH